MGFMPPEADDDDDSSSRWVSVMSRSLTEPSLGHYSMQDTPEDVCGAVMQTLMIAIDKHAVLLSLTSCKNATVEPVLIKGKRKKRWSKEPIGVVGKTIVLRDRKGKIFYDTASAALDPKAIPLHSIMGHRKTYVKERPLFGRYVGTYIWKPQMRGDVKHGIIEKDYEIKSDA